MSDTDWGARIEQEVSRRGITYRQAAEEIGIGVRSLRKIRNGTRSPSKETRRSLTRWIEAAEKEPHRAFQVAAGELDGVEVASSEPDPNDLTRREQHIARKLRQGIRPEAIADDIGERPSVVARHLANLRRLGYHVYADADTETVGLKGEYALRSSEHIGQRTRQANRWWQDRHDRLVRAFRGLDTPNAVLPHAPGREDWVTHLTDLHAGDYVRTDAGDVVYSTDQVPTVIEYATRQSLALAQHHNAEYDAAHLLWGGDFVTNEGIYEGQHEHLDAWLDEQHETLIEPLMRQLKAYSRAFPAVQVVCMVGNHGRHRASGTSRQANADLILYKSLRNTVAQLQEHSGALQNVRMRIGQAKAYRNFPLRGGRLTGHLRHGQHRKPQATTSARKKEWLSTLHEHDFDLAYMGHHHISGRLAWDGPPILATGSPKPSGEFVERLGEGVPSEYQTIATAHGVTDEGITCVYPIDSRNYD